MIIYPAIFIEDERCKDVQEGEFKGITNPVEMAKKWESMGAKYLHVVDGDRITSGALKNVEVIKKVISSINIPVQVSGGIKSIEDIEEYLNSGAKRVVINAMAGESLEVIEKAVGQFGEKLVVGINIKDRKLAKEAANETTDDQIIPLAQKLEDIGVDTIVYTDMDRAGMLKGSDIVGITEILSKVFVNIIAAGGINDITDSKRLSRLGVSGVIIGKALYTGDINLTEAMNQ